MSGGAQPTGRGRAMVGGLAFGLTALTLLFTGPASAEDLFNGASAINPADLNSITTIDRSIISTQEANITTNQHGNTVEASGKNSKITTGNVAGNVIMNNRGITTSINNSGNNVSVNHATIVNVILSPK